MFTVIWKHVALDTLADIVVSLDRPTREPLVRAVDGFNHRLGNDPMIEGESRDGIYRVTFVDLLFVRFSVEEDERIVRVLELKRIRG